jgi:hypothetical protein
MRTVPIDSADVREQRELDQARAEAERAAADRHAATCRGGWLGLDDDERPIACPRCRPHLLHVPCRTCSVPWQSCQALHAIRRGRCCPECDHLPAREDQLTVPRRNARAREPKPTWPGPADDERVTYAEMAERLVELGLAAPRILGPLIRPWRPARYRS